MYFMAVEEHHNFLEVAVLHNLPGLFQVSYLIQSFRIYDHMNTSVTNISFCGQPKISKYK